MDNPETWQAVCRDKDQDHEHCVQCETIPEVPEEAHKESSSQDTDSSAGSTEDVTDPALDGGYGWVIIFASFFNAFIIDGISSSFGLIFPYVVEKFESSASVTSFAGSLFVSFLIMGSVTAELVRRFGFRVVSIAGGILGCLAFVIAASSPNIIVFILSYGLLAGCACGLVFLPSVIVVNAYFHRKRGLANGIITSGSGAGLLVLAPLINFLLETYALNGTVLIMAGILLHMSVFSSFYRPLALNSEHHRCGQADTEKCQEDSLSSNLSAENLDQCSLMENNDDALEETGDCVSHKENQGKTSGEASENNSKSIVWQSASDVNSVSEHGDIQERKPKSYTEYLLSLLKSAVSAPQRSVSSQKGQYGSHSSIAQERPHRGNLWKSEYQLGTDSTHKDSAVHPRHSSSVQNIPTWYQHKGSPYIPQNAIMKDLNRHQSHNSQHQHHHHHKHHHSHHRSHHQHSDYFTGDHGSNLYLAGSISTLMSLHSKHIIHNLQGSFSASLHNHAPNLSSSKLQVSITEIPTDSNYLPDSEKSFLHGNGDTENMMSMGQTKLMPSAFSSAVESIQPTFSQMISVDSHNSNRSFTKSGYSSLSEMAIDLCIDRDEVPVPLPPTGYTIRQLLCMPSFHLFSIGASLIQIGYYVIGTFLADYAYQNGLTASHTGVMMGVLGGLNIFGRLLSGALASWKMNPLHLNNASLMVGGIACLLVPLFTEFWSLVMFAGIFGFFLGFFPPLQPLILVEYFGLDSLASAFGFLSTIKGVASVIGAPLAGVIYDVSGQYSMSFVFAGATFVASSLVHCFMPCARR